MCIWLAKYILAHDLGTSGNKATLFSEDGKMVGSYVAAYRTEYFNGTWAEQDAEDWWNAVCVTSKRLIESLSVDTANIAVVSFSGQMMGCLCVDKTGKPLRRAIIWADQRAQKQMLQIESRIAQKDFLSYRWSSQYSLVRHSKTDVGSRSST